MEEFNYYHQNTISFAHYLGRIFALMFAGLMTTAMVSLLTVYTGLYRLFFSSTLTLLLPLIAEFSLVFFLTAKIHSLSKGASYAAFIAYAAVSGLTFAIYPLLYGALVYVAFFFTAIVFGCMAIIGFTTSFDLSRFHNLLLVGLIAILTGTVLNIFLKFETLDLILAFAGVLIFLALVAFDIQKIKQYYAYSNNEADGNRFQITAALNLYLDFINIFIYVLRIFARERD